MGPRDREIELLERDLEELRDLDIDPAERARQERELRQAIRDVERDFGEEESWREEGRERGWG